MEREEKAILLGKKISQLRESKSLSIRKLAKNISISDTALAKIESGSTKSITIELGKSLCEALDVSFYELFDFNQDNAVLDLSLTIKGLEQRISELEQINRLQDAVIKNYKNVLLEAEYMASSYRLIELSRYLDENVKEKKIQDEIFNIIYSNKYRFFDALIEWGCLEQKDIDSFQEKKANIFFTHRPKTNGVAE